MEDYTSEHRLNTKTTETHENFIVGREIITLLTVAKTLNASRLLLLMIYYFR